MEKKYIFIDVDGTLFDHSTGKVPDSSVRAIRKARENGHKVFLSTGRAVCELGDLNAIEFDGFVCSNGGVVEIDQKLIGMESFSHNQLNELMHLFTSIGIGFGLEGYHDNFMDPVGYELFVSLVKRLKKGSTEEAYAYMEKNRMWKLERFKNYEKNIAKITLYTKSEEKINALDLALDNNYEFIIHQSDEMETYTAELSQIGVSKASGVRKVLDYFHADRKDTFGYGDSLNDYEMIKYVQMGVAMGNGVKALKEVADDITESIGDNGLYNSFLKHRLI